MSDKKKPTHTLYYSRARNGGGEQSDQITAIGAAWPHQKGNGFSLSVDVPLALSAGDRLVLFERKDKE